MRRLLLTIMLLGLPAPAAAENWTAALAIAGPSIVRLQMETADGETGSCSGVIIGPEHILTAAHCVDAERLDVTVNGRDAEVVRKNRVLDLAVLRVRLKDPVPIDLANAAPAFGSPIAALGFPLGAEELTVQAGIVAHAGAKDGTSADIDVSVLPGDSGGGIIDYTGRLVGITTGYRYAGVAHLGRMVALPALRSFIEPFLAGGRP